MEDTQLTQHSSMTLHDVIGYDKIEGNKIQGDATIYCSQGGPIIIHITHHHHSTQRRQASSDASELVRAVLLKDIITVYICVLGIFFITRR